MDTKILLLVAIVGAVFVAGCVGQVAPTGQVTDNSPGTTNQNPQPETPAADTGDLYEPPTGTASIQIISPEDGARIEGTTAVGVRVEVENFRLVGPKSELRDNEGQIHAVLEGPTINGQVKKEQYTPIKTFSFTGVSSGTYSLTIELVDNNKMPLGISERITITVA